MVSINQIKSFIILACFVSIPATASSQTDIAELFESELTGDTSKYSVPATILEDHELCKGPGHVAYAVEISADDVDFEVSGDGWAGTVWRFNRFDAISQTNTCIVGEQSRPIGQGFGWGRQPEDSCELLRPREQVFQENVAPKVCYRSERRGTEVTAIEVDCPGDSYGEKGDSLNALLRAANVRVDMTASATVCRTLTGTGLLDSTWSVEVLAGDRREVFRGTFSPNRWFDPRTESPINVRLLNSGRDLYLMNITEDISSGPFQLDPMRSGHLRMALEIDELVFPGVNTPPVKLEAGRSFRLDIQ